jgi:hypothetical protein
MSNWSNGWAQKHDSTMTTPADEGNPNPFKLLGLPTQIDYQDAEVSELPLFRQDRPLDGTPAGAFLNELPADVPMLTADIPMVDVIPPDIGASSLCTFQPDLEFEGPETMSFSVSPEAQTLQLCPGPPPPPLQDGSRQPLLPAPGTRLDSSPSSKKVRAGAVSMARDLWEALQLHVQGTKERLMVLQENHLVELLCSMSAADIAGCGLRTLHSSLGQPGAQPPLDLICFTHLIYSMSLIVHKEDAQIRGDKLFTQVVSYASQFSKEDRQAYFPIVDILWKPNGMSEDEVVGLMRKTSSASRRKGKQTMPSCTVPSADILVSLAQIFLDELEHAAVQELDKPQLQSSGLCRQHMDSKLLDFGARLHFGDPLEYLFSTLVPFYGHVPTAFTKVQELRCKVNSGNGITARRLELELMHVGLVSNNYVWKLRAVLVNNVRPAYLPTYSWTTTLLPCEAALTHSVLSRLPMHTQE